MPIFNIHGNDNFVVLDRTFLKNKHISWKAKGILGYLLTNAENWQIYETEVATHSKDGIDSLRSGIQELISNGYIFRRQLKGEGGKFAGYEYHVFSAPQSEDAVDTTVIGISNNGNTNNGKSNNGNPNTNEYINKTSNKNNKNIIKEEDRQSLHTTTKQQTLMNNISRSSTISSVAKNNAELKQLEQQVLEVIDYLNATAGKRIGKTKTSSQIVTIYSKGIIPKLQQFGIDTLKDVIDVKVAMWKDVKDVDKNNRNFVGNEHLVPETLFGGNFTKYVAEAERYVENPEAFLANYQQFRNDVLGKKQTWGQRVESELNTGYEEERRIADEEFRKSGAAQQVYQM